MLSRTRNESLAWLLLPKQCCLIQLFFRSFRLEDVFFDQNHAKSFSQHSEKAASILLAALEMVHQQGLEPGTR